MEKAGLVQTQKSTPPKLIVGSGMDNALVSPGDGLRVQNGSRFGLISTSRTPAVC